MNKKKGIREASEIVQLKEFDVPYFSARFDDRNLYSGDSLVEKDYFEKSLREQLIENLNMLSDDDKKRQLEFIRNSLIISKENIMQETDSYYDPITIKNKDNPSDKIEDMIFKSLKRDAVWNKEKTMCSFLNINCNLKKAELSCIDYSLYNGLGLILFLFAYAKNSKKAQDMELLRRL